MRLPHETEKAYWLRQDQESLKERIARIRRRKPRGAGTKLTAEDRLPALCFNVTDAEQIRAALNPEELRYVHFTWLFHEKEPAFECQCPWCLAQKELAGKDGG